MNREIKFRQPVFEKGKFVRWHYWGLLPIGFVGVIPPLDKAKETSQQFTGLKDKKGKEIWEGDIVDIQHPHKNRHYRGEIIFDDGRFNGKDFSFPHHDSPTDIWESDEYIEVIGNIFENHDLLIPTVSSSDTERK